MRSCPHGPDRHNIPALAKEARLGAAHVLAQLAVVRTPLPAAANASPAADQQPKRLQRAFGAVEEAVVRLAERDIQQQQGAASLSSASSSASADHGDASFVDILSAAAWPDVPEDRVLLSPLEVTRQG